MTRPDLELLADLDAGLLDEDTARAVRASAEADPAARAVLDALAATRADLAVLPDPPVPAEVAARWSAALNETALRLAAQPEAATDAPLTPTTPPVPTGDLPAPDIATADLPAPGRAAPDTAAPDTAAAVPSRRSAARQGRTAPADGRPPRGSRRSLLRRPAVLAGAVLIVLLALAALFGRGTPEVKVDGFTIVQLGLESRGLHDTGGFEDPARRASCLATAGPPGVAPAAPLLGGRLVTFEGRDGVLLLLGTGRIGVFDVVVVDPGCSTLLAARRIGG